MEWDCSDCCTDLRRPPGVCWTTRCTYSIIERCECRHRPVTDGKPSKYLESQARFREHMAKKKSNSKGKSKKKLVRVDFRRNRNQPARDHSWTQQYHDHQFEDAAPDNWQSHQPKGDMSRKRTIVDDSDEATDLQEGTVIAMRGLYAEVDDGAAVWQCITRRILRTRLIEQRHPVTVGDRVRFWIAEEETGVERTGVIHTVMPRTTQLIRSYGNKTHVIAANLDLAVIVASVREPVLKPHLIDRCTVSAEAGGLRSIICLNKIDLDPAAAVPAQSLYEALGYPVLLTSIVTGQGIEDLARTIANHRSLVVGQSGVGKSSLLNTIQPDLQLTTSTVSESTEKGRHTTTQARLIKLDIGGYIADTPGVKSFELADIAPEELEEHFIDIAPFVPDCKFADCTHLHEEGCAVQQAVEDGHIHPQRFESYVRMYEGQ